MRILHVIQELAVGGAERVVTALARGAADAGHEVAVASAGGRFAAEIPARTFALRMIERRPWRLPGAAYDLAHVIRRWKPEVVHCHNPGVALPAAAITLRGRGVAALVSVHGVPDEDWRRAVRILRLAGLPVVACGPGIEAALVEHGLSPLRTIWNGVGPPPPAADRARLLAGWNLAPETRLVAAVGRLVAAKNHELAIEAISRVPDAALVIVGEGPMRPRLEAAVRERDLSDRVVLAGERSDARALIGAADALVFSSRSEGLPLAALEALGAGTPVVATAVRGLRELLVDGETALLVPFGDALALAAALERIIEDHVLRDRIVRGGLEVAARHDERTMVSSFLGLYAELVK